MKLLFGILILLISAKECEDKNQIKNDTNENVMASKGASIQQKEYTIVYSAISRGLFKEVRINNATIAVKKDRNSQPTISSCSPELWREMTSKIDSLDLESLSKLEAPTQKRLFDGAAHALLRISVGDKEYTTASFDHGFPPKEIELLCNSITKLIEQ